MPSASTKRRGWGKSHRRAEKMLEKEKGITLTDKPEEADYALLFLTPSSGEYFNATPGYLELEICDGKEVCDVDEEGRPAKTTHTETTLSGAKKSLRSQKPSMTEGKSHC